MALAPFLKDLLDTINSAPMPEADPNQSFAKRRDEFSNMMSLIFMPHCEELPPLPGERDMSIAGRSADIGLRVYHPSATKTEDLPCHVFLHGGAWWLGDLDQSDSYCRRIASTVNCVVVSVEYSLAPEAKFPTAVEECYDVVSYLAQNPQVLNIDINRLSIGGASAGANIAAAVALMLRDREGAKICCQVLEVPATDTGFESESVKLFDQGYLLSVDSMREALAYYLEEKDWQNPYAAPLLAKNLEGLPPALVITAEYDVLRDQGEAYGQRLQNAGVATAISRYDGMIHGFSAFTKVLPEALQCIEEQAAFLRQAYSH